GKAVEGDDFVGQLFHRADAVLQVDPRVGGSPLYVNFQMGGSAAGDDDAAVGAARLQVEHRGRLSGPLFDEGAGGGGSDFFIGGEENFHRRALVPAAFQEGLHR